MGGRSGGSSIAGSVPECNGGVLCLNGSPPTSPSHASGRIEAGSLRSLCRLLLLGFPDRSVEQRYAQFKV